MRIVESIAACLPRISRKRFARVLDEVLDDSIFLELLSTILQILPHQVLGEGEDSQMGLLQHLPLRDIPNRQPERLQHLRNVDSLLVGGQQRIQANHVELKRCLQ